MASNPSERGRLPGQVTPIAWMYAIFGLALFLACLAGAQIGEIQLYAVDAFLPLLIIIAAAGAILRRPWGRWLCYAFSVLILPGVPLGTIIGGLMIYHLTVHRDQFRRAAGTVNHGG
jgi:hypothetical protein